MCIIILFGCSFSAEKPTARHHFQERLKWQEYLRSSKMSRGPALQL